MSAYYEMEVDTAPLWLRGVRGTFYHFVVGIMKDGVVAGAKLAVKARFAKVAPADALPRLLRDANLLGSFKETEAVTRARLLSKWATWRKAGTVPGMLAALSTLGYSNVAIIERTRPGRWWTFRVRLRSPYPFNEAFIETYPLWGSANWGDVDYSGMPFADEVKRVRETVLKWKPVNTQLDGITFQLRGPYWGEFTWDDGSLIGGLEETWT